jgi:hypothetical protein
MKKSNNMKQLSISLIVILGISFWFFLGFPFANHNESYMWIVQLNNLKFLDMVTQRLQPIATYRPLGQAIAWLGYRFSKGSVYPLQIFNYLVAIVAWLLLFYIIKEKKVLSLISLIISGFFFSGYIYIFHLHGVFYSPLLLFISFLLIHDYNILNNYKLIVMSLLAIIVSLFHPFALLIYLAFIIGLILEKRKDITKKQYIVVGSSIILMLGLIKVLLSGHDKLFTFKNVSGLITSYKMTEINLLLSFLSFMLSITTAASINIPYRSKLILYVFITFISLLFFLMGIPIIIIWILVCLLKVLLTRKWSIALLIFTAFSFPLYTGTGSPTYAIFVLMACAYAAAKGWLYVDDKLHFVNNTLAVSLSIFAMIMVCCLRCGINIPLVSKLANPLLAEREKTFQLEDIINWMMESEYKEYKLILNQPAYNPIESVDNAINRKFRAPTSQYYLNDYINSLRPYLYEKKNSKKELIVCFGMQKINNLKVVYIIKGKYSGNAIAYLPF